MNPATAIAQKLEQPPLRSIRWRFRGTGREARILRIVYERDRDLVFFRFVDEPVQRDNLRRATAKQFLADMERVP